MIHIFCTYVYLYLVSYDATVLIHDLCYETQWPGFTPFPPLTLFLLRSSAWSIARMGWGEAFLELSVLRKYFGNTHEIQALLFAADLRSRHHQETFPSSLLTKGFLLNNTICPKCLEEKDYENQWSMTPGIKWEDLVCQVLLFFQANMSTL